MDRKNKSWGSKTHIRQLDLKAKAIQRDKEGQFIINKRIIHQEDISILTYMSPHRSTQTYKENLGVLQERHR